MALDWLQQHPEEISQVVLINTSVGGISPPWRRLRLGGAWGLVRAALASDVSARERHVFGFTSARLERQDEVVARWTELARARPVHRATAARHLLAASRFRLGRKNGALLLKEAIAAGRPVLVLVSQRDGMVASACSLALAAQLGTPVRVHATAGHDLPLDDPEWVIAQIAQWQQTPLATGPGDS